MVAEEALAALPSMQALIENIVVNEAIAVNEGMAVNEVGRAIVADPAKATVDQSIVLVPHSHPNRVRFCQATLRMN